MTPRGELLFMTSPVKVNSDVFIRFLCRLFAHHRRRKLVLIVDRSTYHRSRKTQAFVAAHADRLRLEYLPANAPELNPDEHVWSHLKGSGATDSTTGVPADVRRQIRSHLRLLQCRPHLAPAFYFDCYVA
jgi:transposase